MGSLTRYSEYASDGFPSQASLDGDPYVLLLKRVEPRAKREDRPESVLRIIEFRRSPK